LQKEEERLSERLVPRLAPKVRRREERRERKALAAAKVERMIERVLIDRLRSGGYGEMMLNIDPGVWQKVLNGLEREGVATVDDDDDEEWEEEEEEKKYEIERTGSIGDEYVGDVEGDMDNLSDFDEWLGADEEDRSEGEEDEDGSTDRESHAAEIRKLAL
jgi:protein MAK16